jgi:hypothetical protein
MNNKFKHIFRIVLIFLSVLILLQNVGKAQPRTIFLSSSGNDSNDGLTIKSAWKTLNKINSVDFKQGDSIKLEGGSIFNGTIKFNSNDNGSPEHPLILTSFGKGKAIVNAGKGEAIFAVNSSNIKITSIEFKGDGVNYNNGNGIHFYSDDSITAPCNININDCEIIGFRQFGIVFGCDSNRLTKGFNNVQITHNNVTENGQGGVSSYGSFLSYQHNNFYIAWCKAFRNRGIIAETKSHTGNGIVMAQVNGLLIEHCEAFENGIDNRSTAGGPVGIWVWMCNNVLIQYCSSHHNYAGLTKDGGGFDLDGGSSNCILQYNYSCNNEGAGYLLAEFGAALPFTNNVIRFNISLNDGRKNGYGAITVWGVDSAHRVTNTDIYNNTIYVDDKSIISGTPAAINLSGYHFKNLVIANNIFVTSGNVNMIYSDTSIEKSSCWLLNNNYYSYNRQYSLVVGKTKFTSVQKWMDKNNEQENLNSKRTYHTINPLFVSNDLEKSISEVSMLRRIEINNFSLRNNSPLKKSKFSLIQHFKISLNTVDFCNNVLPKDGIVTPGICVN